MEFNRWGRERFDRHDGVQPIDESHRDVPPPGADASRTSDDHLSNLAGQLSDLQIERGNATGRRAPAAPRTARPGGSARFEPTFYRRDNDFQSMRYGCSYAWHMDSTPPGDIPIYEIPDTPPDAAVTHHNLPPLGAGGVDPSRRASTSEVPRVLADARPGPSQSMRMTGRHGGRSTRSFDYAQFLRAVRAWGTGKSREAAAREASMGGNLLRTYLDGNGLTNKGEAYLQELSPAQRSEVRAAIAQRSASGHSEQQPLLQRHADMVGELERRDGTSGHSGIFSRLGRGLRGIIGSSSRTAPPASHPPIAEEAPVQRERERSGRWDADAGAGIAAAEAAGIRPSLPANYDEIMRVLPGYERNVPLPDLQKQLNDRGARFQLNTYFSPSGTYHKTGKWFHSKLPVPAQQRLDAALRRRASLSAASLPRPAHYDDIMGEDFLHNFGLGMMLQDLARHGHGFVNQWFRADGSLQPQGQNFRDSLNEADGKRFDAACAQRQTLSKAFERIGRNTFKKIAQSLAKAGASGCVEDAAKQAGVAVDDIRLFLTDDGLTAAGHLWLPRRVSHMSHVRTAVQKALDRWIEQRSQHRPTQHPEHASPAASFFEFPVPGGQGGEAGASQLEYEQDALWASLEQPPQAASPSASFFDFPLPGAQYGDVSAPPGDYEQEALWNSLEPRSAGHPDPYAAGPSASSQPESVQARERRMQAQAIHLGIPFFGADVVGHEWQGASFVDHYGQPFAYATDRLAGHLAALLHSGEIESGGLVCIRDVNYRVQPIGGRSAPTPENPHGLMFALYPI